MSSTRMTILEKAIEKDAANDLVAAAELYERSIEVEGNLESYLNLAFLYFQFNDFGFNSSSGYSPEFKKTAFARLDYVIDRAIEYFPEDSEASFLKLYFRSRIVGMELSEKQVLRFVAEKNATIVPYFYLYLLNPKKYKCERDKLLEACESRSTSKQRWIHSLIESEPGRFDAHRTR